METSVLLHTTMNTGGVDPSRSPTDSSHRRKAFS